MLQAIRDKSQGWIAWVIVGAIALPFALWGVNSYFDIGPPNVVAILEFPADAWFSDEQEIHMSEFEYFRQRQNKKSDDQTLSEIIDQFTLDLVSAWTGIRVGEKQLNLILRKAFTKDGTFDSASYQIRQQQNTTVRMSFKERVQREVGRVLFRRGMQDSSFTTKDELNHLIKLEQQTRNLGYVIVPKTKFLQQIEVSDEEIDKYYQDNKNRYMTVEKHTLEYIELKLADFVANIPDPNQEELQERFDAYKNRVMEKQPEERRARQIIIKVGEEEGADTKAQAKIYDLHKQIDEGADFAEIAKKHSQERLTAKEGGDLGFLSEKNSEEIDSVFKKALFALAVDEVSKPFKNVYGYNILKLTELRKTNAPEFDHVKAELINEYKSEKAEIEFDGKSADIDQEAFETRTKLASVAKNFGLKLNTVGPFESGKGTGIAALIPVKEALKDDKILNGVNSGIIEAAEDRLLFIRVKQRDIPTQKTIEEVKKQIVSQIKQEKSRANAKKLSDSMHEKIKAGEKAAAVAKLQDLAWKEEKAIKRDDGKLNFSIRRRLFQMPKPTDEKTPVYEVVPLFNGDSAIVALYSVNDGSTEGLEKTVIETAKQRLKQRSGYSEWVSMMEDIRANTNVQAFPDRL